jgi:hypothetical protein
MPDDQRTRLAAAPPYATIARETFDGAALSSVRLHRLRFDRCTFAAADLRQGTLERCSFKLCDLRRANLRGASLRFSTLSGCDLRDADLRDCDRPWPAADPLKRPRKDTAVKHDFGLTCIKSGQQEAGRPGLAARPCS